MIKTNELREGLWVLLNGKPIKLDWSNRYEYAKLEPIPLTLDILEKCGFYRTVFENEDALRLDLHKSVGRSTSMIFFPGNEENGVMLFNNATPIGEMIYEYLHQIQNLHYVFTGQELNVNL